jgi:3-isopropylmalate/(R)-2-methylmalate dehydratase small subunit
MLPEADVQALMEESAAGATPLALAIDVRSSTVVSPTRRLAFSLSARHRTMFLEGLDMVGASLKLQPAIDAFARRHWAEQPWVKDVARRTMDRLDAAAPPAR